MGKKKKEKEPLTPPDFDRCQAEKPNGNTFMTLGGKPGMVRCDRPPTVLLTEKKPAEDGQVGSMTLCDGCLAQFRKQMPKDFARIEDIADIAHWRKVGCDVCHEPISYMHPEGGRRCAKCPRPA